MGLPRPPEQFERVYSAPEPPSGGRRPRVLAVVVGLAAFALVAGAVFVLVPGGDDGGRTTSGVSPSSAASTPGATDTPGTPGTPGPSTGAPSGRPSATASPSGAEPITSLPMPCGTVPRATVTRLVPNPQLRESSNSTLTTCTFSSTGEDFRWLRVEAHLYAPANTATPVEDARRYYGAQWTQAQDANAALERTVRLERASGLGDEAFRWFKVDKGQPTVVGQVTMRVRNVVVTVAYSEQARDEAAARGREKACLANAAAVAREVRDRFG